MKRFLVYLRKLKTMSPTKKAYAIAFLLLAGILVWAFFTAGLLTNGFSRSQLKNGNNRQEIDVDSMILTETKDDKKFWEIYGESGTYNSDEKIAMLNNVVGNFYKDNEVAMSFESSQGSYNEEKGQIILYNNTYVVIKDGTELNCDRLVWSGSDKDIIAVGNVKVNRNGELISTGDKVTINPSYDNFKIEGNTTSTIYTKDNTKKGTLFQ